MTYTFRKMRRKELKYTLNASYKRALAGKTLTKIDSDALLEKSINQMLVNLIGEPGVSAGKSTLAQTQTVTPESRSSYTSSQLYDPSSDLDAIGAASFKQAAGIGLLNFALNQVTAAQAYARQNQFYDAHMSMPAKVKEYQDAGLNPMALAGAGVGATSAPSVPQAEGAGIDMGGILQSLLGYKTQMAAIEVDKERVQAQKDDIASRIEYRAEQRLYQQKVNEWFDTNQTVNIQSQLTNIQKGLEEINTEKTKQALNMAGVSETQARACLEMQQALYTAFENSPEYRANTLALQRARANADNANAAHAYEDIKNLAVQRDKIQSEIALNYVSSDIGRQQCINLGLNQQQIEFAIKHQKGDLVFQRINQVTSSLRDVGVAAAGIASAATGTAGLMQSLASSRPIGFN